MLSILLTPRSGGQAVVRMCSNKKYAVKEFRKRRRDETEREYVKKLVSEFCISSSLDNPHVVKTVDLIQGFTTFYSHYQQMKSITGVLSWSFVLEETSITRFMIPTDSTILNKSIVISNNLCLVSSTSTPWVSLIEISRYARDTLILSLKTCSSTLHTEFSKSAISAYPKYSARPLPQCPRNATDAQGPAHTLHPKNSPAKNTKQKSSTSGPSALYTG